MLWQYRSVISMPASRAATYRVLEAWQIPPPYICTRMPPRMPPAGCQPLLGSVLSPRVPL